MSVERLKVDIKSESDKAYKVEAFGREAWIPKSQIEQMKRERDTAEIVIPSWLFKRNFED